MADQSWGSGYPNCQPNQIITSFSVDGTKFPGGIRRELAELVSRLVRETKNRGYKFGNSSDPSYGCWGYSCRAIAGSRTPSNHSWGLAVDINAPTNPYTSPLKTDMPGWMRDLWKSYGFRWGGDYSGRKDAMHYEFMGSVADAANYTNRAVKVNLGGRGGGGTPPTPTPTPPPSGGGGGSPSTDRQPWTLPPGHYLGPVTGPAECHSGDPKYDDQSVRNLIASFQKRLNDLGFNAGTTDGLWGDKTGAACLAWQQHNCWVTSALCGPNDYDAVYRGDQGGPSYPQLHGNCAAPSAPVFPLPAGYYYGPKEGPKESISGMAGEPQAWIDGLKTAQARLNLHLQGSGKAPIGVDGKYGNQTRDATKWFQSARGLSVDGLIGANTWHSLWQ